MTFPSSYGSYKTKVSYFIIVRLEVLPLIYFLVQWNIWISYAYSVINSGNKYPFTVVIIDIDNCSILRFNVTCLESSDAALYLAL